MEPVVWIIIAAVVVVLLAVLAIVFGLKRAKDKAISFEAPEEPKELTQQERSGNYQARGAFQFQPAKQAEPVLDVPTSGGHSERGPFDLPGNATDHEQQPLDLPEPEESRTVSGARSPFDLPDAEKAEAAPAPQRGAAEAPAPQVRPEQGERSVAPAEQAESLGGPGDDAASSEDTADDHAAAPREVEPIADPDAPRGDTAAAPAQQVDADAVEEAEESEAFGELEDFEADDGAAAGDASGASASETSAADDPEAADAEATRAESDDEAALQAAAAAGTTAVGVAQAKEASDDRAATPQDASDTPRPSSQQPAVGEEPASDEASSRQEQQIEEIAPASGRLGKLRGRLSRSQNVIGKSVLGMLTAGDLDEDAWEDVEAQLIQADLGVPITTKVVEQLREMIAERGVRSEAEARAMLRECLVAACQPSMDRSINAMPYEGKPAVVLVVGVNGTGKTTTTGKLARVLVSMGHKVTLGAADTFRAAAADQLETWGRRVGAKTVRGAEGADPASVAFDATAKGIEERADVVLIDTAGRLHNSSNLMDQLGKVKRVVSKKAQVDEVLLVLDATTGQNGLTQARVFSEVVQITGVVLTKLDGTAKGGIVFQVQEELGVPVKLVGLGEGADDLAPFEVESFVDALLG